MNALRIEQVEPVIESSLCEALKRDNHLRAKTGLLYSSGASMLNANVLNEYIAVSLAFSDLYEGSALPF